MSTVVGLPVLRLVSGKFAGQCYELRATLRVGRHPFNEISLADLSVSRYHCWIAVQDGTAVIEDLASGNGTFVNGDRLHARRPLKPGDRILVGNTQFVFSEDV